MNEQWFHAGVTRFPLLSPHWPRDLSTYLNIVIEAGLRGLQVKVSEGQLHHIAFWDDDIPAADVIVGVWLGVIWGSDFPKKFSWHWIGTGHSKKEDGPQEKRTVPVNMATTS